MDICEFWQDPSTPSFSFEVFPPKTERGNDKLFTALDELAQLNPSFFSVTFGAGGSTREGSHSLIQKLIHEKEQNVIAYFAGFGLGPGDISTVLESYQALGVEQVLVVRGDPPREEGFTPHQDSFTHADQLIEFISSKFDFMLGAAGYPEGHIEADSLDSDIAFLKSKIEKGARYIITNYFYDNDYFFKFRDKAWKHGIDVPIVPGIMPVYSAKMTEMLAGLCGATITKQLKEGIDSVPEDNPGALAEFGIEFALEQCRGLIEAGIPGLHFYTMNKSTSAVEIVTRLKEERLLP